MLIITRRSGQAVDVTDKNTGITTTVLVMAILNGNQVRLGIEAPPHMHIVRDDAKRRDRDGDEENNEEPNGNR